MPRSQFPRTFELIDLIEDRADPRMYFREFESKIADCDRSRAWQAREREFQSLDRDAWELLKAEAQPYLATKNPRGRAWSQLISTLNEALGYLYVRSLGCTDVHFLPKEKRNGIEFPDVRGMLGSRTELCEVKTIHISDDAIRAREEQDTDVPGPKLPVEFLGKLDSTIDKAKSQLNAYSLEGEVGRTALIVINFDERLGEYKVDYYQQIDAHLGSRHADEIDLVFFNSRTASNHTVTMTNAMVVNE